MDQDFQSQIDRANELLKELEEACNDDLKAQNVSGKTKNLSQEVLTKIRHTLDQAMYKFFEEKYASSLSDGEKQSVKIYFPIVPKQDDLKAMLGRAKMTDMETRHPEFWSFLQKIQPYNSDYAWLTHLAKYASEKHIRLTPQKRMETRRVTVAGGNGSVSWGSGVTFGSGVSIMGVPIDPRTQMPVPNNIVETKVENWISFLFDDSDINVLWLCKKAVEDGEKIIVELLKFAEQ